MTATLTLAALGLTVGIAGAAGAETFRLTMGASHPTVVPWVGVLSELVVAQTNPRLEAMGSEDRVEWTESYGGALFDFDNTLEGVQDGLADAGWVGSGLWEEAKMPLETVTYYAPFITDDLEVLMRVTNDLHAEGGAMGTTWADENLVFLGSSGVDTYHLLTDFPVETIEDLRGKKILAPGPSGNWMAAIGAVPVNGGLPTYYNSIQSGVADGTISIFSGTFPNKIHEVAPYVTLVGLGAQYSGGFAFNRDSWDGLSDDVRAVMTALGAEYSAVHAQQVAARYDAALEAMRADPDVTVTTLAPEERAKWIAALPDLAGDWAARHPQGEAVLGALMDGVRAQGVTPGRDWDR